MRKKCIVWCSLLTITVSSHSAWAGGFSVAPKISTLGPGIEVEQRLGDNLGIRLGVNYLPISTNFTVDDVRYKADFSWKNAALLADFYPFAGMFRLTGGVFYNGNTVDVSGTPSGDVQIGDNTYSASDIGTISGSVDFKKVVPYAGIGWSGGNSSSGGWSLGFDLGVMFQGSPSVGPLQVTGALGSNSTFTADLEKERADIKDEMDTYQYYPVAAFGVAYHF